MDHTNGFTSVNSPQPPPPVASPPAADPTVAGTKRKRSPKTTLKFYAVRVGKEPGIYHTWAECLDQVRGFPKAAFKSFTSLTEAQAFVNGETGGAGTGGTGGNSGKFYAVREGRVPGVYTSWPEVLEQITGWRAPKHKVFKTRAEAELFVKEGPPAQVNGDVENADDTPKSKKAKTGKKGGFKDEMSNSPGAMGEEAGGEWEAGEAPLPDDAEDGFDPTITLDRTSGYARYKTAAEFSKTKYQASRPVPDAPVRIYTDGSTLSNGQIDAIGGVGVYFGPKDKRNISEPLTGTRQTNQRAELTAILRALEVAPRDRRIIIFSDSHYAIKCVTEWYLKWRSNGWHNSSNRPVENKDLITKVIDMLDERLRLNQHRVMDGEQDEDELDDGWVRGPWEQGPAGVRFTWVKGHAKDEGNNAADELAVNGAKVAKEFGEDIELD